MLNKPNNQTGFSLIELLVVIGILGILTTIAIPNYNNYLLKGGRAEGKADLTDIAAAEEQFFLNNKTYSTDIANDLQMNTVTESGRYNLTAAACTGGTIATCYLLTATAAGKQAGDPTCSTMTLDSVGQKTPAGCW